MNENYVPLYRKYRPQTLETLVGQEHVKKTLTSAIELGKISHAYLFTGPRGTGKTSTARILAKSLNCVNGPTTKPCGECASCKDITNSIPIDVIEIDAASNRKVEDTQAILEKIQYVPVNGKFKIYIIDEVHMLTNHAFNALLKTLEEPPAHVKFVLATTEPQKLPATILSRCQRFDFKKISNEYIIQRLEIICKESNIDITPEALKLIAILAEGGMRDAISILERCIQDGETHITDEKIKDLVGIPKLVQINRLVSSIINYNASESLQVSEEIIAEGKDILNMLWEVIKYIKDMLIFKTSGDLEIYSEEEKVQIKELVQNVSVERLIKLINELSELENSIKWSSQRNLLFEIAVIKLSSNFACSGFEEIEKRISNIEEQLKSGKVVQNVDNVSQNQVNGVTQVASSRNSSNVVSNVNGMANKVSENVGSQPVKNSNVENISKPQVAAANSQSNAKVVKKDLSKAVDLKDWKSVVDNLKNDGKMMLYTNLVNTTAKEINDMTVGIEFKKGITPFGQTVLEKPENMQYLVKLVSQMCGKEMRIKLIDGTAQNRSAAASSMSDMPFNIIE